MKWSLKHQTQLHASAQRRHFDTHQCYVVELLGSPGCGKTSLIRASIPLMGPCGVVNGEMSSFHDHTDFDPNCKWTMHIDTSNRCHLEARDLHAIPDENLDRVPFVFVENVGNLVCPTSCPIGAHLRVLVLSVAEGADKLAKYPVAVLAADVLLISKTDLLPFVSFDLEQARRDAQRLNPLISVLQVNDQDQNLLRPWVDHIQVRANAYHLSRGAMPMALIERIRLQVKGMVQGVGFRPFVFRLAQEEQLTGFVNNGALGVTIEAEGDSERVAKFVSRLQGELPRLARIVAIDMSPLEPLGNSDFVIVATTHDQMPRTLISPDVAMCDDCLNELHTPLDPRFAYPFINCTNCGPRFTIIRQIPYDRPYTSLAAFAMCDFCKREYMNPSNRRFHAQPVACPNCGPHVWLEAEGSPPLRKGVFAIAADLLRQGRVLAIRGLGGFHLAADPRNSRAIAKLRTGKGREHKPFAVMVADLKIAEKLCCLTPESKTVLADPKAPIVLLPRHDDFCDGVAPGQSKLGLMLPYTPLHQLLFDQGLDALVMTSGNLSDEPIATEIDEAKARLKGLCDGFLLHNRDIVARCDDSVVNMTSRGEVLIRRARGYVPEPVFLKRGVPVNILACGGQFKATSALARDDCVFLSQHLGDQDHAQSFAFFLECTSHLQEILEIEPAVVACDLHPEYLTAKWARAQTLPRVEVQHHHAHLASLMAEHHIEEPILGVVLDGTGYGLDDTIWGGELLFGNARDFERLAWLEPVPMPGGERAIKEPQRMAIAYLRHLVPDRWMDHPFTCQIDDNKIGTWSHMMAKGLHAPLTSSCGRLFDGVAAMLGIRLTATYEAQAAIELEMIARDVSRVDPWPFELHHLEALPLKPLLEPVVQLRHNVPHLARAFHETLAAYWVRACELARDLTGCFRVGLTGGVFQNELFTESMVSGLEAAGFDVFTHRQVPPNDGGIALGQVAVAAAQIEAGRVLCA